MLTRRPGELDRDLVVAAFVLDPREPQQCEGEPDAVVDELRDIP